MSTNQSTIIERMASRQWQFAYNNDGSFHATGPATSGQDVSYNLVLDGNRLLSSKAGSLWKISAEMNDMATIIL